MMSVSSNKNVIVIANDSEKFSNDLLIFFLSKSLLIKLFQNAHAGEVEVVGCGGFIKSHADIDFSRVEIKL